MQRDYKTKIVPCFTKKFSDVSSQRSADDIKETEVLQENENHKSDTPQTPHQDEVHPVNL